MQIAGSESYIIRMGDHSILNFAAFIGSQEGFDPSELGQSTNPAEKEWQEWWLSLPASEAERMAYFQEAARISPYKLNPILMQKSNPANYGFNPPEFSAMPEDKSALKELCLKYWPQFHIWSKQEEQKYRGKTKGFPERIKLHQIITGIEKANGRKAKPFKLQLDFVYWPENYLRVISDNHLVMMMPYGSPEKEKKLAGLLQSYIAKLA